ncbi:MAG TPA: hypothetical protein VI588_04845 [Candidatus Gracilibacteria bacterium]|nr:hypothetical protein [Candidatus Gracilibacteria bacterium]
MNHSDIKPAVKKSIAWFIFGGTATLCAFALPALVIGKSPDLIAALHNFTGITFKTGSGILPPGAIQALEFLILISAAYHSAYRLIASEKDLRLSIPLFTLIAALIILSILQ